ncbi:MAG: CBS domain-containing protein [Caldilineaceae bacterium]|nr:CBS domain-containing protein [Caldilineaceae bacterium]MCB0125101.1 CBS domain-containing protein [Caldilineaceae bacterium]
MNRHESEVRHWMTAPAVTVQAQTSLLDAYNYMTENDIRRLPVTDKDGFLVGILTMSDILRTVPSFFQNEDLATDLLLQDQKVNQVMTADPISIEPDDTVQDAAEAMLEYQVSGLPVTSEGRVVGVITESDIFRLVVKSWGELVTE